MKIGIIVYSKTGNTLSVAEKIKEGLSNKNVKLERIEVTENNNQITLVTKPDINEFDAVILGAPVNAFSLAVAMQKYLKEVSLKNKKIVCFVTEHFPYPWMGGNHAIKQMKKLCQNECLFTGVINWSNKEKDAQITNLVKEIKKLF